jgi:ParB family chromosome partitioning protein
MSDPVFKLIDHDLIDPNPSNVRHKILINDRLRDLARSIEVQGILEPIIVQEHPTDAGRYELIAGHRRLAAAALLDPRPAMPSIIRSRYETKAGLLGAMFTENGHREDLSPIEEAQAYQALKIEGLGDAAISKLVALPLKRVRARQKLVTLDAGYQERLHIGHMTLDMAEALVKYAGDPVALREMEEQLDDPREFKFAVTKAADRAARKAARTKVEHGFRAAGIRVLESDDEMPAVWHPGMTPDPYALRWHSANGLPASREEHEETGCGALAVFVNTPARIDWYCLDPAAHGQPDPVKAAEFLDEVAHNEAVKAQDDAAGDDAQRRETEQRAAMAKEAAAQQEAEEANCRAAARLRQGYIADLIRGHTPMSDDMADAIARHLALQVIGGEFQPDPEEVGSWVGIDPALGDLAAKLASYSGVRTQLILVVAHSDPGEQLDRWSPAGVRLERAYLDLLGGPLGYEWSTWEAARLDESEDEEFPATIGWRPVTDVQVAGRVL